MERTRTKRSSRRISCYIGEAIKGDETGHGADEEYSLQRIDDHILFVSWIEKDGVGVSQVLNFRDNKINVFLKFGEQVIPLSGSIEEQRQATTTG